MFRRFVSSVLIALIIGSMFICDAEEGNTVTFENGGTVSVMQISESHSIAFLFNACCSFDAVSVSASSIGNNKGNLTVSLYKYADSYEKTIKEKPQASSEFVDFKRNDTLTLFTNCESGKYLIVISDPVEKVGCYVSTERGNAGGLLYEDGYEVEGTLCGSIHFTDTSNSYFESLDSAYDMDRTVTTPKETSYSESDNVVSKNVYPSTWTCTDGLGRTLPLNETTGDTKKRYVAVSYWTWSADYAKLYVPQNVEEIIKNNPEAKNDYNHSVWKTVSSPMYFWDEPLFGYYSVTDEWVIRKHAELLAAAGVDVIFFDNTNSTATWQEGYRTVFEVFAQAREDGVMCPDISFTFGFAPSEDQRYQLREIYLDIFRQDKYRDLWFYWDGKPLVMAYSSSLHSDDKLDQEIAEFFTFREPLAKCNGNEQTKAGQWCWLDTYPQHKYYDASGNLEMMPVGTAINWNEDGMTAFNGENVMGRAWTHDKGMSTEENAVLYGAFFAEQFEYAIEADPELIFVVGWNEWVAGHFEEWCGVEGAFPDEFNDMYSRDIEPSAGQLKDHYYYQLCYYIRLYKGTDRPLSVSDATEIDINGSLSQWDSVTPAYYSYQNNVSARSSAGFVGTFYENNTGRNDIVLCKVARDDKNVYFYVETKDNLTDPSDDSWMRLYIDTKDSTESWEGYEYIINRVSPESNGAVLEKATGNGWDFEKVANVKYSINGNVLVVEIPLDYIGITFSDFSFNFKWADNTGDDGDIMSFYQNGDAAPLGRFNYNYDTANVFTGGENDSQKNNVLLYLVLGIVGTLMVIFLCLLYVVLVKNRRK